MGFLKQHISFKNTKKNYGIIGNKVKNTYLNNTLLDDFEILGSLGNVTKYLKSQNFTFTAFFSYLFLVRNSLQT